MGDVRIPEPGEAVMASRYDEEIADETVVDATFVRVVTPRVGGGWQSLPLAEVRFEDGATETVPFYFVWVQDSEGQWKPLVKGR